MINKWINKWINKLFRYFAKKYALSFVNAALAKAKDKCDTTKYINKTQEIVGVLNELLDALKDNTITQDECDSILNKTKAMFSKS